MLHFKREFSLHPNTLWPFELQSLFDKFPIFTVDGRDKTTSISYESGHMRSNPMNSLIPHLSFEHQKSLGRPSCPRCGQLCLFPERMEYAHGRVRNCWHCDRCHAGFETSVALTSGMGLSSKTQKVRLANRVTIVIAPSPDHRRQRHDHLGRRPLPELPSAGFLGGDFGVPARPRRNRYGSLTSTVLSYWKCLH